MFAARYTGVCRNCKRPIKVGDKIFPVGRQYAHVRCPGKPVQLTLPFKKEK